MEHVQKPRRRLNILTRTARTKRIFARLREGWAYDEIAKEERLSAERVRQIVSQVLENRVLDSGDDHAHMQIERLRPALRIVGQAVARGDLKAIGPLIKLIDRLDKHQGVLVKPFAYTEDHRKKLLDKLNWMAENLAADEEDPVPRSEPGEPAQRGSASARKPRARKIFFRPDPARKSLKRLVSDERIQGIPRRSRPAPSCFLRRSDAPLRRPEEIQIRSALRWLSEVEPSIRRSPIGPATSTRSARLRQPPGPSGRPKRRRLSPASAEAARSRDTAPPRIRCGRREQGH